MNDNQSKYKRDLKVMCYSFSITVIQMLDTLPNKRSCYIIGDQLLRSATSIGANLIEASSSSSRLEFKKFHEIALKSGNETKYWLGLLRDSKLAEREKINILLDTVNEITNMIASGVLRLKGKK